MTLETVRLEREKILVNTEEVTSGGLRAAAAAVGGGGGWFEKIKDPFTITMRSCDGVTVREAH